MDIQLTAGFPSAPRLTQLGSAASFLDAEVRASLAILVTLAEAQDMVVGTVLAHCANVPNGRLDRLVRPLMIAGMVTAQRGRSGGYTLTRPAASIQLIDVVNAVRPGTNQRPEALGLGGLGSLLQGWLASHSVADLTGQRGQRGQNE
jgi:hypothetical protein